MSDSCCSGASATPAVDRRYRRVLWIALVLNAAMFVAELVASWSSGSVSLLADSIDFFGDAANYALSLAVLGMALSVRSKAALFKAACMGGFGVFVTLVHADPVLGLDWATAAWIFIVASALGTGFLLARRKTTLR